MNLQDFPEASRKPPFHFRRGSSSSTDEHQVGAAAAPHHHINPPAPQVKKKSGFQITSVTSAQVSGNNSLADDTESYDDMDESHTEDLSSSEVPDVSAAAVPERSSSDETLNSLHGVETPPPPSPNEPPGLVNGTMVATHHQRHGPDQLAIYKTRKQPEKPGEISILDNANTVTTVTPNTHHQQSQTTTGSRFRVVKLDTNSEPFRKGRWTCTDFYDKEAPPPPLGTDPPPDIESGYDFAPAAQSPPQPPTEPSPSGRPAAIRLPDFIRPTAPFQTQVVPPPLLAPPPQPLPYRPLTALQADLRPLLAPGGGAFPRGGGAAVVRATSQLEDAQKLLLGVPAGDRMAAEANAFMAAAAAVARSHHGDGDDDSSSGASVVAIDNKIEQAMDLVKSHLMFAVREEVEVLKEQIKELLERNNQLEQENDLLKNLASPEQMAQFLAQVQGQGQGQGQGLGLGQGQVQTQGQFQDQLQGQGHSQVQGQVQTQTSSSGSPTVATVTTSASQQLLLPHPNSSGPLA